MTVHSRFNLHYMAVLFCLECGSNRVDIARWTGRNAAVLRCAACDHETPVIGFTVGRVTGDRAAARLVEAAQDQASPDVAGAVSEGVQDRAS